MEYGAKVVQRNEQQCRVLLLLQPNTYSVVELNQNSSIYLYVEISSASFTLSISEGPTSNEALSVSLANVLCIIVNYSYFWPSFANFKAELQPR